MDSLNLDLLALETMKLGQSLGEEKTDDQMEFSLAFGQARHNSSEQTLASSLQVEQEEFKFVPDIIEASLQLPQSPGVLYRLLKGANTFIIRGIPVDDLSLLQDEVDEKNEDMAKLLRINEDEEWREVTYFCTKNQAVAEVLCDELINRRFPKEEDHLCNLSDPGFSWWMDQSDIHFNIYFQSHGVDRASELIQLGPLGDCQIASRRLDNLKMLLHQFLPISEMSISEKYFSVKTTTANDRFEMIRNLFLNGDDSWCDTFFASRHEYRTLYLYIKELAALRRLWIEVKAQID